MKQTAEVEGLDIVIVDNEVGTDNLKTVIGVALKMKRKVTKYLQDGKINAFEGVGISLSVLGALRLVPLWPAIKLELADLDEEELAELVALVAPEFGVDAEQALEHLQGFVDFMDALRGFFNQD